MGGDDRDGSRENGEGAARVMGWVAEAIRCGGDGRAAAMVGIRSVGGTNRRR
jgi:hypothetical protein